MITDDPILIPEIVANVGDSGAGAVALFVGVVRDHNAKGRVRQIHYESYKEMAEDVMAEIENEMRSRWKVENVVMIHRTGLLEVGEASVAVAVSSAHREEAFDACRYGIDNIKSRVPVWKKEIMDSNEEWVKGVLAPGGI